MRLEVVKVGALALALTMFGVGCFSFEDGSDDDTGMTDETEDWTDDTEFDGCGEFDLVVTDWSIEQIAADDYRISTLFEVEGPQQCYVFEGVYEHDALALVWSHGITHTIVRTHSDPDHSAFGPRWCDGGICEIGDIFETSWVYPNYPEQQALQALIDEYGPPDEACGIVSNAEQLTEQYCGQLVAL